MGAVVEVEPGDERHPEGTSEGTPCTTFVIVRHRYGAEDDEVVLDFKVEFLLPPAADPRTVAIAAARVVHASLRDSRDAAGAWDVREHEWNLADITEVLIGHSLPVLAR